MQIKEDVKSRFNYFLEEPSLVRKANKQDAEDVFYLVERFATSFKPNKEDFEQVFCNIISDDEIVIYVAEYKGDIIGYCLGFFHPTFYANGKVAWLEEIMINEDFRRKGTGTELLKAFEQEAKEKQCKLVALATRRASDFYLANDYEDSATYFRKLL